MFYEDVEHSPPWLLHLALPQPIRSEGNKEKEGEVVRCFYNAGTISKRISRVEKHRRLSFDVVEANIRSENYTTLKDGSFEIEPVGDAQSRITLTTRYERQAPPRLLLGADRAEGDPHAPRPRPRRHAPESGSAGDQGEADRTLSAAGCRQAHVESCRNMECGDWSPLSFQMAQPVAEARTC